jgi:hypothetical protein
MDADDISLPGRFSAQAEYLDRHPEVAVVGTDLERFGAEIPTTLRTFARTPEQMKVDLFFTCGLAHPTVMLRKSCVEQVGYDPEYEGLEDYELWCRISEAHGITVVPQMLFRYRVHGAQVTKNPSEKYIQRMCRLKQRQLAALGLPVEGERARAYYDFCLGKRPGTPEEGLALARLLESAAKANAQQGVYRQEALCGAFRAVLLGITAKLKASDARRLCEETHLITPGDLRVQRLKGLVKRTLRRG